MSDYLKFPALFPILLLSGLIIIQQAFFYLKLKSIYRTTTITSNLNRFLDIRQVLLEIEDLLQQRYRHLSLNRIRGHLYGNLFLKRVAERLRMHTRISAFLYRFGGDEFVLVLSGSDRITALNIASLRQTEL